MSDFFSDTIGSLGDWLKDPVEETSKGLSKTGKTVASDPILRTAATAAGYAVGGPVGAGLVDAGLERAEGKSYEDAVAHGVVVGGTAYIGGEMLGTGDSTGASGLTDDAISASGSAGSTIETGGAMANGTEVAAGESSASGAATGAENAGGAGDFSNAFSHFAGGGKSQETPKYEAPKLDNDYSKYGSGWTSNFDRLASDDRKRVDSITSDTQDSIKRAEEEYKKAWEEK